MTRTILGIIRIAAAYGAISLFGDRAVAQRTVLRGLPDAPVMVPIPASPTIGPSSGALAPSAFAASDTTVIGGRARGGSGRVPHKFVKITQAPTAIAPRVGGPLTLPEPLPDSSPTDLATSTPFAAIVEDDGPADGLTLDVALARTIAANLDLLSLKYEIPQADADILTAGLRANPLIYADAQFIPYGRNSSARPLGPTEYDIIITHPLDVSNKRRSRVEVARAAKCVVEAQFQDAVRRQVGNLYRAYVDLQLARLNLLTSTAAVADQEQVVARGGAGDNRVKLESQLEKARDARLEAADAFDDAREAIALLMSVPPEEAQRIQPRGRLRVESPPPPPLEDLTRMALGTRPDLVAARRGFGRSESEVKLAMANRLDDVFIFYDPLSYQDNRPSHLPSGRSWAMGLTVPVPIYNRNQGNIARARSNVTQTQVELVALERRVKSEVRLADREYQTSRQALERAERSKAMRGRQARLKADADFAAGKIPLSDYLDRIDDENDAARTFRDALVRHRRAMLDLNTTVGVRLLP